MKKTRFFERCTQSYRYLNEMCNAVSRDFDDITFSVIQCDSNYNKPAEIVRLIKDISDFYNENWLGNADYLHVPDARKVLDNYLKYPIIMAYRENEFGQKEILGVATLKYYQNTSDFVNPYYPIKNRRFFEITGILTKKDSGIKNIGKRIYEILIKALMEYQKVLPEFDVIFVADCRNYMSISGAWGGAKYVRDIYQQDVFGKVVGVYTVKNNGILIEAPTLVAKIEFASNHQEEPVILEFNQTDDLFQNMLETIFNALNKGNIKEVTYNMDGDDLISFYGLTNGCINLEDITIIPNGTDLGNERIMQPSRRRMKVGSSNE